MSAATVMGHARTGRKLKDEPKPYSPFKAVITILAITLKHTDAEVGELQYMTWASGPTEQKAIASWRRECPAMCADFQSYTVITPNVQNRVRYPVKMPLGNRRLVQDELLAVAGRDFRKHWKLAAHLA